MSCLTLRAVWLFFIFILFFFKSASNRPFLTMDKYQLPAAPHSKAPRVGPSGFVFVPGNLPVTIKRLQSLQGVHDGSFARPCFPREREFYDFSKTAKVTWGESYQFSEDIRFKSCLFSGIILKQQICSLVLFLEQSALDKTWPKLLMKDLYW